MAKGTTIGFLNFGMDGDNKALLAKIAEAEKNALRLQTIMQSIGKGNSSGGNGTLLQQTRSQNAINESLERQRALQERTAREAMRTEQLRQRMLSQSSASQNNLNNQVRNMNSLLGNQEGILGSLTKKAAGFFSVYQAGNLVGEIVKVRGEIQQLEFAFETMLGSKAASENMMKDIVNLSLETPYTLTEMAGNVKQLIAMGIEADKVVQTMKNLGDVAAGVSVPIWRIAINYGQVAALGKLQGREVRDFAMAGVPIVQQLADQMGKTTAEIQNMVSAGKIGFPDVEEAFRRMSSEGGKFNNMMQKQNSSVLGQIGKLKEQVQLMLNSIGESSEGVIYGALSVGSELVHNYEAIGKALVGLVATYGTYKTILVLVRIQEEMALQASLHSIATARTLETATVSLTRSQALAAVATKQWSVVMKALNASMLTNPYVLVAAAIVGMGYALYKAYSATTAFEDAQNRMKEASSETTKEILAEERKLDDYNRKLTESTKGSKEYLTLKKEIVDHYGSYFAGLDAEIERVGNLSTVYNILSESVRKSATERMLSSFTEKEDKRLDEVVGKNIDRVYDMLMDRYSDNKDKALEVYNEFYESIKTGAELSEETETILKQTGMWTSGQIYGNYLNILKEQEASRKAIEAFKEKYQITDDNTPIDIIVPSKKSTYQDDYNEAKENWLKAKKNLESIQKDKNKFTQDQYKDAEKAEKEAKNIFNSLGGETKDKKEPKKDPIVDNLRKQIELIKTAQAEYGKLKQMMSEEDAFAKIKEQIPFKDLSKEMLSDEGLLDAITAQITELSGRKQTDATKDWLTSLFSLKNDTVAKINKRNTDQIEKGLKEYKAEYSLYESLFAITGDKEQSTYLAFGDIKKQVKSYREELKEAIGTTTDPELKKKLTEELTDLEISDKSEFSKRMAELVKEFQSTSDKINTIRAKGEEDAKKIREMYANAPTDIVDKMLKANEDSVNKQISDLTNGMLQSTESYQRLFSNMSDITSGELKRLISEWKTAINTAEKGADGRYTILIDEQSVSVTEKELSSLTKHILKSEKELRGRNPFKALFDDFNELRTQSGLLETTKNKLAQTLSELVDLESKGEGSDSTLVVSLKEKIKELEKQVKELQNKNDSSRGKLVSDLDKANKSFNEISSAFIEFLDTIGASDSSSKLKGIVGIIGGLGDIGSGLSKLKDGDISGGLAQSISGISSLISSVGSLFWGDKGLKEYEKAIEVYKKMEEVLSQVISRQKELLSISAGSQSVAVLKNAIDAIEKQIDYQKKVLDKFMDSGGSAGSHSKGYRETRYIKKWQDELQSNGFDIKSWEDLYKLSADEIYDLQSKMPEFYADLFDETKNYLELIIDKEKELIELKQQEKEALTGLTFDTLLGSLDSLLQASNTTFGAIGDSFEDHMRNAVLNFVKEQYLRDALTEWQDQFADAYRDDELSASEVEDLRKLYEEIYNKAQNMYDSALDVAGVSKESASKDTLSKGIESVTEDTANLLASYINAIRSDVSVNREYISQLVQLSQLNSNTFAAQLAELVKIQVNTLATANNTSRLVELSESTNNILQKATISGSGTKINI